jgi:ATP-dependent DNA ligase
MSSSREIPAGLAPPIQLALAKAVEAFPGPNALPGTMCFEPKWDGYRLALFRGSEGTQLWSRQGKNLTKYFPELVAAATDMIPAGCIVDGEAVVWTGGRLSFESLQQRLTAGKNRLEALANELPANFVAFDVLCVAGHDARSRRLRERRALLEQLASDWTPPLSLSPWTTDLDLARHWFKDMPTAGLEGLIIKGDSQPYLGGQRVWLKYKRRSEMDIICGAVVGPINRPTEIVAGLPIDGELRIVGRSSVLRSSRARRLHGG